MPLDPLTLLDAIKATLWRHCHAKPDLQYRVDAQGDHHITVTLGADDVPVRRAGPTFYPRGFVAPPRKAEGDP